jgi:CDP-glucose 4,6-dehydratase
MDLWSGSLEVMVNMISENFWQGKRVLVTGHTGFKGSWLSMWLYKMGAEVTGVSLVPSTSPNLFELARVNNIINSRFCDIRNYAELVEQLQVARPELIIHLAAQSLVRPSYVDPLATFATNVMGSANLLEAVRVLNSVRVIVMVTTDKVYLNNEWIFPYREEDTLGGHDPYSASKAASEILIASYRDAFFKAKRIAVASARAGNVIGGGDWSEDRLIPDAVRAWEANRALDVRSPQALRPWQHVLEPLYGYLTLAEKLWHDPKLAGAFNFGPDTNESASVFDVIEIARKAYANSNVNYGHKTTEIKEAGLLAIENIKSRLVLGVKPRWNLAESVERTMQWYLSHSAGHDAHELCLNEITQYERRLAE